MRIKALRLERFTSYKDHTNIDNLSPGVNVIVGRNGAGKSNLFAAISFVLGETLNEAPDDGRRSVVFNDRHSSTMQAWVEITFDNSDRTFPLSGNEIVVRRTSSPRNDSYHLNGKPISLKELKTFLESGGFSGANQFYIVPQGRVSALATASDEERLSVVLSISGATLYNKRRAQSLELLSETDKELIKTKSRLSQIKSRLEGLKLEMTDLERYLDIVGKKHSIEFVLLQRESVRLDDILNSLAEEQEGIRTKRISLQTALNSAADAVVDSEEAISEIRNKIAICKSTREIFKASHASLEDELYQRRRDANLMEDSQGDKVDIPKIQMELSNVKDENTRLEHITQEKLCLLNRIQQKLRGLEAEKTQLECDIGQRGTFTANEREKWISDKISEFMLNLKSIEATILSSKTSISGLRNELSEHQQNLEAQNASIDVKASLVRKTEEAFCQAEKALESLESKRSRAMLDVKKSTVLLNAEEQKIAALAKKLQRNISQSTLSGILAVRQIARDLGLEDQVHGTVAELITIAPQFQTAVERVGGNSLLNIVVKDSLVAKQMIDELLARKNGTITFLPLDLIRQRPSPTISSRNDEALLLSDYIEVTKGFEVVVDHIFGGILVCSKLALAHQYSRKTGCIAVSLMGEVVDPRGAVSGGYSRRDGSKTSFVADVVRLREMETKICEHRAKAKQAQHMVESLKSDITAGHNKVTEALLMSRNAQSELDLEQCRLESLSAIIETVERQLSKQESEVASFEKNQADILAQIEHLQHNTSSSLCEAPFDEHRSLQVEHEIAELAEEFTRIESELKPLERRLGLNHSVIKKLSEQVSRYNAGSRSGNLPGSVSAYQSVKRTEEELESNWTKVTTVESELVELDELLLRNQSELEARRNASDNTARMLYLQERQSAKLDLKLQSLQALKTDNSKKASEVRQVSEIVLELQNLTTNELDHELELTNSTLKNFDHVNKRSIEQFQTYSQELEELEDRHGTLNRDMVSVGKLIDRLDQDKNDDIRNSFEKVNKAFQEIFARLTGRGANLALDESQAGEQDHENSDFKGVRLEVDFGDGLRQTQQLSGGQKTICALALIFAVQSFEPAPFYVFDEIDASLDPSFRRAVASLISEVSSEKHCQFICTTFRPELVSVSSQLYGVSFAKGASQALPVTKQIALSFVDADDETVSSAIHSSS
ncbi:Chromosome segregation protein sudA [Wickerhamiella sorbophila]|uniref:Structural maintenance of chromosomes protein n=1 Tax=Wickerhamiella sorbophila TaxID=45607 RepID=A0A2T0FEN1_9ASCO|nr:Chromosome segregation protein sudA [Wickerhamiella sorbophila]PRT53435.1 Chromosome segregation protein sudA [Wickerhamiella sorbophila]